MTTSAGPASRTPLADAAERAVASWVRYYTRDLEVDVARDRRLELESDLWEQKAAAAWHHRGDGRTAASIVGRAVRGFPSDLGWRRDTLGAESPGFVGVGFGRAWTRRGSVLVGAVIASGALLFALLALGREMLTPGSSATISHGLSVPSALLGAALLVGGLLLLGRSRSRWMSALWLGAGCVFALRGSADIVFSLSATAMHYAQPRLEPALDVALAGLAVFYALLGASWALPATPRGPRRGAGDSARAGSTGSGARG